MIIYKIFAVAFVFILVWGAGYCSAKVVETTELFPIAILLTLLGIICTIVLNSV